MFKKILALLVFSVLFLNSIFVVYAIEPDDDIGKITAKAYVLIEASTGKIIVGSNEQNKLPIASTTKIMTALITLEQQNIYEDFLVDEKAILVEGTSMGLKPGDKASFFALANGMLLSSGNDGANAAAVKIGGSIDKFAAIMNKRAKELSMNNTNFITPSGLHHDDHYSTAYDMALLARAAINNPDFLAICSKTSAKVTYGNPPYARTLKNHNRLLKEYEGCIGVKTGFTKKAGRCLVSAARRDGVTLICVTLGAADDWNAHKKLFNYGFSNVEMVPIKSDTNNISINIVGGLKNKVKVKANVEPTAPILAEDMEKLTNQVYIQKFYYAPIKKGDVVGEINHLLDGNVVATTILVANEDVQRKVKANKKSFFDKIKYLFKDKNKKK